jgi:hypothetical protein
MRVNVIRWSTGSVATQGDLTPQISPRPVATQHHNPRAADFQDQRTTFQKNVRHTADAWDGWSDRTAIRKTEMNSIPDAGTRRFYWLAFGGITVALFCAYAIDRVGLSGEDKDNLIRNVSASCMKQNPIDSPENAKYPAPLIEQYCTCFATGIANRITKRELAELREKPGNNSFETEKEEIERSCFAPLKPFSSSAQR